MFPTSDQAKIIDYVLPAAPEKWYDQKELGYEHIKIRNTLIVAPGGCGKSFTIQYIKNIADGYEINTALTALTGVAAYNIGGSTLHRYCGIGLGKGTWLDLAKKIVHKKPLLDKLKTLKILIIDEVSMMSLELFEKLDLVFQYIRRSKDPYGGLQLVLSGDPNQLPPVNGEWFFKSELFEKCNFKVFTLTEPLRYTDKKYFNLLMRVRNGYKYPKDMKLLEQRREAYLDLKLDKDHQIKPTFFYSCNKDVNGENAYELQKLKGKLYNFECVDSFEFKSSNTNQFAKDNYLKLMDEMIPSNIQMKVGAQVMLKANIDPETGFCNGSRGVVLNITDGGGISVKFLNNPEGVNINRYAFEYEDDDAKIIRMQIPLVLAWSMTIHKCLVGDTKIVSSFGLINIADLFYIEQRNEIKEDTFYDPPKSSPKILTHYGTYQKLNKIYYGTVRPIIQLSTRKGFQVCVSSTHKLKIGNEWKEAHSIVKNDVVELCRPNILPTLKNFVINNIFINDDIAFLLGCIWTNPNIFSPRSRCITFNTRHKYNALEL